MDTFRDAPVLDTPKGIYEQNNLQNHSYRIGYENLPRAYTEMKTSANIDTGNYGNPMKNHATGPDIHPYNISLLPVISY